MMLSLSSLEGAYDSQILSALPQYCPSCPPALVLALVNQESGGNQFTAAGTPVTGASGDTGLFQLIPSTAAGLNVDPTTVAGNIQGGETYLQQMYNQFGNWPDALAAYNEGPGAAGSQIAAGQPLTSAGYASSILTAAGMPSNSPVSSPSAGSSSGDDDSGDDDSGDDSGGLSSLAYVGIFAGLGLLAWAAMS
jgi:hypothetical protein